MLKFFHIPQSWNIEDFYNLDYTLTTHKDSALLSQYQSTGHHLESMTLYNCHQPKRMPDAVFLYIKPKFDFLHNIGMAVNLFKPGQYLPLHVDLFGRFVEVTGAKLENIVRYMVMLEDAAPGQILQIGNQCHTNWQAGDCFGWQHNESHALYNFSMQNRYAIQVTGTYEK